MLPADWSMPHDQFALQVQVATTPLGELLVGFQNDSLLWLSPSARTYGLLPLCTHTWCQVCQWQTMEATSNEVSNTKIFAKLLRKPVHNGDHNGVISLCVPSNVDYIRWTIFQLWITSSHEYLNPSHIASCSWSGCTFRDSSDCCEPQDLSLLIWKARTKF